MRFHEVISDRSLPTRFSDAELLLDYLDADRPHGDPEYLSLGETWSQTAPGLLEHLRAPMPSWSHGYVVTQYGLPRLVRTLRRYVPRSHRLPADAERGRDYEIAAVCSGTRNAMFDFARLVHSQHRRSAGRGRPTALVFAPGWDYSTVFTAAEYALESVSLRAGNEFCPDVEEVAAAIRRIEQDPERTLSVLVINAQHNPTAVNWPPDVVRSLVRMAFNSRTAVLLDDAYFAVHDPDVEPTSSLAVLIDEVLAEPAFREIPWLAVRSLGKQFDCNGWGIGAMTGSPTVVSQIVNDVQFQRSFVGAVPLQQAMASWLDDERVDDYLAAKRTELSRKREYVSEVLVDELHYPVGTFQRGECTTFLRFPAPEAHGRDADSVLKFRDDLFHRSGIMLGLDPNHADPGYVPWLRMFLGPPLFVLMRAVDRLDRAGFSYRMHDLVRG